MYPRYGLYDFARQVDRTCPRPAKDRPPSGEVNDDEVVTTRDDEAVALKRMVETLAMTTAPTSVAGIIVLLVR